MSEARLVILNHNKLPLETLFSTLCRSCPLRKQSNLFSQTASHSQHRACTHLPVTVQERRSLDALSNQGTDGHNKQLDSMVGNALTSCITVMKHWQEVGVHADKLAAG